MRINIIPDVAPTIALLTLWCSWSHAFRIESPMPRPRMHSSSSLAAAAPWLDVIVEPTTTTVMTTAFQLLESSTLWSSTTTAIAQAASAASIVSPEPIHTAFSVATFLPQPFFVLLILFPKASITKQLLGGFQVPFLVALVHFFIVVNSILLENSVAGSTAPLLELNNVFDPFGDPQAAFLHMVQSYPNFVAEEWSHVLTWDFFVGLWIWQDGLRRDIFTSHSVLFCNLIGPPGLLLHWLTCVLVGKPPLGILGDQQEADVITGTKESQNLL